MLISLDSNTFYYAFLQQFSLCLTPRGPLSSVQLEAVTPPKPITFLVKAEPLVENIATE